MATARKRAPKKAAQKAGEATPAGALDVDAGGRPMVDAGGRPIVDGSSSAPLAEEPSTGGES